MPRNTRDVLTSTINQATLCGCGPRFTAKYFRKSCFGDTLGLTVFFAVCPTLPTKSYPRTQQPVLHDGGPIQKLSMWYASSRSTPGLANPKHDAMRAYVPCVSPISEHLRAYFAFCFPGIAPVPTWRGGQFCDFIIVGAIPDRQTGLFLVMGMVCAD